MTTTNTKAATNSSSWHRLEGKVAMLHQAHGHQEPTSSAMGAAASMMSLLPWRVSRQDRSSVKALVIVEGA